jgi:ferritin-like metal-binding protein YciE
MADTDDKYVLQQLKDVHAIEEQSLRQLERACELAKDSEVQDVYRNHLEETKDHERLVKERIEAHDEEPSAIADLTMQAGALGVRQLSDFAPDTPSKLAAHFYAFEHLEIANYEVLCRVASQVGDDETAEMAKKIVEQERAAAEKVAGTFDAAVSALLEEAESERDDREREPA